MLRRHFSTLLLAVSAILPATANADLLEEVIVTATRSDQAVSSIVSNISIIDAQGQLHIPRHKQDECG